VADRLDSTCSPGARVTLRRKSEAVPATGLTVPAEKPGENGLVPQGSPEGPLVVSKVGVKVRACPSQARRVTREM
jgi:hypothetical protein